MFVYNITIIVSNFKTIIQYLYYLKKIVLNVRFIVFLFQCYDSIKTRIEVFTKLILSIKERLAKAIKSTSLTKSRLSRSR